MIAGMDNANKEYQPLRDDRTFAWQSKFWKKIASITMNDTSGIEYGKMGEFAPRPKRAGQTAIFPTHDNYLPAHFQAEPEPENSPAIYCRA